MKTKNKLLALFAISIMAFTSCKKEEKTPVNTAGSNSTLTTGSLQKQSYCPIATGITCNDGLLTFDTYESFESVVKDIQDKYDESANTDSTDSEIAPKCFEADFNYTSLRSVIFTAHMNALTNEAYDPANDMYYKYFMHTGIRTVCNSSGEVKIGTKLYIYTAANESFIVESGDRSYTQQINNGNFSNLDGVKRYAADGSVIEYTGGTSNVIFPPGDCAPDIHISTKNYSNNRKLVLTVWVANSPFVNSSGSEVRAYKKILGKWSPYFASDLFVDYGGTIRNRYCDWMAQMSGNKPAQWAQFRHASNDVFTSNSLATNVFRTLKQNEFAGGASASGCSYFWIYAR